ncbi:potassium channel family protein [Methanolobus halotolerans]|uniref:Potassium channel protein n=1 Tax=Methanolobus halotolerans TaxID=2052935 RepID=A0A4E0Q4F3_9EURY|nr:potassium channel protein [Methanolobus halotolerans]TGC08740.1 potassium channel protein [Methanolobus halotolerans]
MKNIHLLNKTIIKSIVFALVVVLTYILIFIQLMRYEQQYEFADFFNGLYWVVSTVTTVGYGDIVMVSTIGKIFSVFVQLSGIPIVFGILFTIVIIPWLEKNIHSGVPTKTGDMKDHIIICGYNRLVETLIRELNEDDIPYVLIEEEQDITTDLLKRGINTIYGTFSEEETLKNANIGTARFVIANSSDARNANIVLTARNLSDLNIIAIVEDSSNKKYLKYAGATSVISPKELYGRFLGRKAADPFLKRLTGATEFFDGVSIVEFPIYPKSPLIGKSISNAAIREKTGVNVVGMWKGGSLSFNISPGDVIRDNSVLLAVGSTDQLSELRKLTQRLE